MNVTAPVALLIVHPAPNEVASNEYVIPVVLAAPAVYVTVPAP